jgi:hypothetical protein
MAQGLDGSCTYYPQSIKVRYRWCLYQTLLASCEVSLPMAFSWPPAADDHFPDINIFHLYNKRGGESVRWYEAF